MPRERGALYGSRIANGRLVDRQVQCADAVTTGGVGGSPIIITARCIFRAMPCKGCTFNGSRITRGRVIDGKV